MFQWRTLRNKLESKSKPAWETTWQKLLRLNLKGLSATPTPTTEGTHKHMHTLLYAFRHACEVWTESSNTFKNIYTPLHQSRQTNELLTDEPTHTHTHARTHTHTLTIEHWNASIPGVMNVTGVLVTTRRHATTRVPIYVCVCVCVCARLTACTQVIIRGLVCAHQSVRLQSEESA